MNDKRFFWFAVALFLVTQGLQIWSRPERSIVDLELAFTGERADRVLAAWEESGDSIPATPAARHVQATRNLWLDFLYIAGYVSLLLASIWWAMRPAPARAWLFAHGPRLQQAAIGAGLLDCLENFLLLVFLSAWKAIDGLVLFVAGIAAALKFLLLLVVLIVFFVWLFRNKPAKEWLLDLGSILKLCRANVIVLIVGWVFLLLVPQGRDVVHALGEPPLLERWRGIFWFYLAVTFWAWNIWYWARVMLRFRWKDEPSSGQGRSGHADELRKQVPRALGVLATLGVAAAFAKAASEASGIAVAGHQRLFWITVVLAVLIYVALARRQGGAGPTAYRDTLTSLHGLARPTRLALGFAIVVTLGLFITFSIAPGTASGLGSAAVLLFAGSAWVPFGASLVYAGQRYEFPAIVVMLVLLVLFSFANDNHGVRELETEHARAEVESVAAHFRQWLDERPVTAASAKAPYPVVVVASEGGGIRAAYWTATFLGKMQDDWVPAFEGDRFSDHVYAISGVSGGSLGAAVFSALIREQRAGRTLHCPDETDAKERGPVEACAHLMLERDFLAPTAAALLYPDLVQRFLPVPIPHFDRGRALEVEWQRAWDRLADAGAETVPDDRLIRRGQFGGPGTGGFNDLWRGDDLYRVPLLFLNTTSVENGNRVLISPLPIRAPEELEQDAQAAARDPESSEECMRALDRCRDLPELCPDLLKPCPEFTYPNPGFIDAVDLYDVIDREIRLSTAAHASARFTFVSPAGTVRDKDDNVWGHVVDGGYFENSGAATALEVLEAMRAGAARDPRADAEAAGEDLRPGIQPIVLRISNDPGIGRVYEPLTFLKEALSPFVALLRTRGARGRYSRLALRSAVPRWCDGCPPGAAGAETPPQEGQTPTPTEADRRTACDDYFMTIDLENVQGVPLGWVLSDNAKEQMNARIGTEVTKARACLEMFR